MRAIWQLAGVTRRHGRHENRRLGRVVGPAGCPPWVDSNSSFGALCHSHAHCGRSDFLIHFLLRMGTTWVVMRGTRTCDRPIWLWLARHVQLRREGCSTSPMPSCSSSARFGGGRTKGALGRAQLASMVRGSRGPGWPAARERGPRREKQRGTRIETTCVSPARVTHGRSPAVPTTRIRPRVT